MTNTGVIGPWFFAVVFAATGVGFLVGRATAPTVPIAAVPPPATLADDDAGTESDVLSVVDVGVADAGAGLVSWMSTEGEIDAGEQIDAGVEVAPVELIRSSVYRNSAGTSELTLYLRNADRRRTIDGFRFHAECYDNFNARVIPEAWRRSTPAFRGESDARVRPRSERRVGVWPMYDFDGCTKAIGFITSVHFTDGTSWDGYVTQQVDPREPERPEPPTRRPRTEIDRYLIPQ